MIYIVCHDMRTLIYVDGCCSWPKWKREIDPEYRRRLNIADGVGGVDG